MYLFLRLGYGGRSLNIINKVHSKISSYDCNITMSMHLLIEHLLYLACIFYIWLA